METTDTDTTQPANVADLLERDCRQLLELVVQFRDRLADDGAEADRSALLGRIGGRLRALAAIETEIVHPHLDGATAQAAQSHARMDASLQQAADADADSDGDAGALDALERELRVHVDTLPAPHGIDGIDLLDRVRARRAQLLLDEKPD